MSTSVGRLGVLTGLLCADGGLLTSTVSVGPFLTSSTEIKFRKKSHLVWRTSHIGRLVPKVRGGNPKLPSLTDRTRVSLLLTDLRRDKPSFTLFGSH